MNQVLVDAGVGSAGVLPPGGHPQTLGWPVLRKAYDAAWTRWNDSWQANRQFTGVDAASTIADAIEREFAGSPALAGVRPRLLEAFADQGQGAELMLVDGVSDAVAALSGRGIRLGIICDVGFTPSPALLGHLERHGLLKYFDHWSFSDEVGFYKPDRRIFEHALTGLGVADPGGCVHVGDRRRTDVAGAQAIGMRAVRITSAYEDGSCGEPSGDVVIASYDELLPALGLA